MLNNNFTVPIMEVMKMKEKLSILWNKTKQWIKENVTWESIISYIAGLIVASIYYNFLKRWGLKIELRNRGNHPETMTVEYSLKGNSIKNVYIDGTKIDKIN